MSLLSQLIFQDAWPKLVDAPLTLIFRSQQQSCPNTFCLERWPIVRLWIHIATQPLHFLWCKAKGCWRSVDAHFQNMEEMLSRRVWPRKAANSAIMAYCHRAAVWNFDDAMSKIVDSPLTLHWCSFFGYGNEHIIFLICFYANQSIHFGRMTRFRQLIVKCVRLYIVDTLLTLTLITLKQPLCIQ